MFPHQSVLDPTLGAAIPRRWFYCGPQHRSGSHGSPLRPNDRSTVVTNTVRSSCIAVTQRDKILISVNSNDNSAHKERKLLLVHFRFFSTFLLPFKPSPGIILICPSIITTKGYPLRNHDKKCLLFNVLLTK